MTQRTRLILAGAAAATLAAGVLLYVWRTAAIPRAGLVARLEPTESIIVALDIRALRQAGILDLIAGSKAAEESDYKDFIRDTGFDYRTDLDHLLLAFRRRQFYCLAEGRFDWRRLADYAVRQGGACRGGLCTAPGSSPEKRISFKQIRRNLLALAVSPDPAAAALLDRAAASRTARPLPAGPLWAWVPSAVLSDPENLPTGLAAFASAIQRPEHLQLSLGAEAGRFHVRLLAACRNPEDASLSVARLDHATALLAKLIARENQKPNPRDLSGVLTSGKFRREDREVHGEWPIERGFLEALAAGGG